MSTQKAQKKKKKPRVGDVAAMATQHQLQLQPPRTASTTVSAAAFAAASTAASTAATMGKPAKPPRVTALAAAAVAEATRTRPLSAIEEQQLKTRLQYRLYQRNHRAKRQRRTDELAYTVARLHDEVGALETRKRATVKSIAMRVLHQFVAAFRQRTPASTATSTSAAASALASAPTSTATVSSTATSTMTGLSTMPATWTTGSDQEQLLRAGLATHVHGVHDGGADAVVQQWTQLCRQFQDWHLELGPVTFPRGHRCPSFASPRSSSSSSSASPPLTTMNPQEPLVVVAALQLHLQGTAAQLGAVVPGLSLSERTEELPGHLVVAGRGVFEIHTQQPHAEISSFVLDLDAEHMLFRALRSWERVAQALEGAVIPLNTLLSCGSKSTRQPLVYWDLEMKEPVRRAVVGGDRGRGDRGRGDDRQYREEGMEEEEEEEQKEYAEQAEMQVHWRERNCSGLRAEMEPRRRSPRWVVARRETARQGETESQDGSTGSANARLSVNYLLT